MLTTPLEWMSDEVLAQKLVIAESMIIREKNPRNLPVLSRFFNNLLREQVRRDLLRQDQSKGER